MQAIERIRTA